MLPVVIPTLATPALLDQCVESVLAQNFGKTVMLIQNGKDVAEACKKWGQESNVVVHIPKRNLGCAASWNYGAKWGFDIINANQVVFLNDDIHLPNQATLEMMYDAATKDTDNMHCVTGRGFSAFSLPKKIWDNVGEFDEGFWPAYYEDNDYHTRMKLQGFDMREIMVQSAHFGSATINLNPDARKLHQIVFPQNQRRYVAKWGGLPHEETYTEAWNGNTPWIGTFEWILQGAR